MDPMTIVGVLLSLAVTFGAMFMAGMDPVAIFFGDPGSILLVLFAVVVVRIWRVAVRASDEFDRLMAVGVMSMFVFQVFQSAGMTMGMMPVTGIPMPFVSYGGSSMLTSMISIGLILGVYRRRFDYVRA